MSEKKFTECAKPHKIEANFIIPAAGNSSRMGESAGNKSKLLLEFNNETILEKTVKTVVSSGVCKSITVPTRAELVEQIRTTLQPLCEGIPLIIHEGGATRQESVNIALSHLNEPGSYIAVHDGARPLCSAKDIENVVRQAFKTSGGAILASHVVETLKEVTANGMVKETVDRDVFISAKTPQVFPYELLMRAHQEAYESGFLGTDESQLVERLGVGISFVIGKSLNIKITNPEDLKYLEQDL